MRRVLVLALLALSLASAAGAQQKGKLTVPAPGVALRGPLPATRPATGTEPAEAANAALAAARLLSTPLQPADAARPAPQCRLTCAQDYYFCLSNDGADDCAPRWGQCRAACDAPGVSPSLASNWPG